MKTFTIVDGTRLALGTMGQTVSGTTVTLQEIHEFSPNPFAVLYWHGDCGLVLTSKTGFRRSPSDGLDVLIFFKQKQS